MSREYHCYLSPKFLSSFNLRSIWKQCEIYWWNLIFFPQIWLSSKTFSCIYLPNTSVSPCVWSSMNVFWNSREWGVVGCTETVSCRSKLLHHYKLRRPHFWSSSHYPRTWKNPQDSWPSQKTKKTKKDKTKQKNSAIFSCRICSCTD